MNDRNVELRNALGKAGYFCGALDGMLDRKLTTTDDWRRFSASWNDLPLDGYMADHGTYRYRRYAEFRVSPDAGLEDLPTTTYRQSKTINYLNGGIDRHYEPIDPAVRRGGVLRAIVRRFHAVFAAGHPPWSWLLQLFQNRIVARSTELGQPTPEGMHRDGVDYVLTLLVDRQNVTGGESSTHCGVSGEELSRTTLRAPGDFIFLDDNRLKHSVEPITPTRPDTAGHRDVLIAMFAALPLAGATPGMP